MLKTVSRKTQKPHGVGTPEKDARADRVQERPSREVLGC
jgi:hypothetical protein